MEQYQYEPLPSPTSIRLIKISSGESSDELSCSFVVLDVAGASGTPKYTALSYVWGDTSRMVSITCENDRVVQVTPSLRDALRKWSGTPTLLWIDAICINQQDIPERNQQVNLMATIYQRATTVSVWLGHDEKNDAPTLFKAFGELEHGIGVMTKGGGQIRYFDEEAGDLHWAFQNLEMKDSPAGSFKMLPIPWATAIQLPAAIFQPDEAGKARLERFFRLPYFSRTWVMQEIGLASNAVTSWGDNSIDWSIIGLSTMFLMRYCKDYFDKLALSADLERLYHLYTAFSPFTPMATFLHVIIKARRYKATDPRDKIFAMLSHPTAHTISMTTVSLNWAGYQPVLPLAIQFLPKIHDQWAVKRNAEWSDQSGLPPNQLPPPLLHADYSKTTEEVYRDMVLDLIDRTHTLEILTAVQHDPEDRSKLFNPSWVPRWDYFINTPNLGLYNSTHFASGNKDAIVTPPPRDVQNTLTVRGHLITRIVNHTSLLESASFDLSSPEKNVTDQSNSPSAQQQQPQELWGKNPIGQTWQSYLANNIDPESYPVLPLYFLNGQAFYDRRANNIYNAFMRTWVVGKNMGEVDGFDLSADSAAYSETVHWGPEGYPKPISFESWQSNKHPTTAKTPQDSFPMQDEDRTRWKRYRDSAALVCNKRKFFFTKKGFFGIGPGALQKGDFIAILLGADAPFVIREVLHDDDDDDDDDEDGKESARMVANAPIPMDRKFRLVGECYVDGMMQGQAIKGIEIVRNITLI